MPSGHVSPPSQKRRQPGTFGPQLTRGLPLLGVGQSSACAQGTVHIPTVLPSKPVLRQVSAGIQASAPALTQSPYPVGGIMVVLVVLVVGTVVVDAMVVVLVVEGVTVVVLVVEDPGVVVLVVEDPGLVVLVVGDPGVVVLVVLAGATEVVVEEEVEVLVVDAAIVVVLVVEPTRVVVLVVDGTIVVVLVVEDTMDVVVEEDVDVIVVELVAAIVLDVVGTVEVVVVVGSGPRDPLPFTLYRPFLNGSPSAASAIFTSRLTEVPALFSFARAFFRVSMAESAGAPQSVPAWSRNAACTVASEPGS
jgi:hypothetical protein